jgi:hypothetical protein
LILFLWWRSFTVPGTKVALSPYLMWGVVFPEGVDGANVLKRDSFDADYV